MTDLVDLLLSKNGDGRDLNIGESMKNLSELIRHEEIYGDQSQRITYLPSMSELRMTKEEKIKKQKRDWYHKNKELSKNREKRVKNKKSGEIIE